MQCGHRLNTDTLPVASVAALRRVSWYDQPPLTFDGGRHQRTMVLVALRDLEDEELFVDYCYHSECPFPEWYSPVERESDRPLWEPPRPSFDWFIHAHTSNG